MTIYIGADHGGFALKEHLKDWLSTQEHHFKDCGAHDLVEDDDYPDYAFLVGGAVGHDVDPESRGILCCRSGGGMVIAANKMLSIRAVRVTAVEQIIYERQHNNVNVLCLGADTIDFTLAEEIIKAFLETQFSKQDRHVRRLAKINSYENNSD